MTMKKRKRRRSRGAHRWLLPVVLAGAVLGGGLFYFRSNFTQTGGKTVSLETTELVLRDADTASLQELERCTELERLDLRGSSVSAEDVSALGAKLPGCYIRWDIPLGGRSYDSETEELTLDTLDPAEGDKLLLFPKLKKLHVNAIDDAAALAPLMEKGIELSYTVSLEGRRVNSNVPSLTVKSTDARTLAEALPLLPALQSVRCAEAGFSDEDKRMLAEQFPHVLFLWNVDMGQRGVSSAVTELSVDGGVSAAELQSKLPLFPVLKDVDIRQCNYTQEETDALCAAFPELHFIWQVEVLGKLVSSDDTEMDLSGIAMTDTAAVEAALPRLPNLQKVIMSDCGFSNEEMDALNQKYEDVRFVWTVYFGTFYLRTDATAFIAAKYDNWVMLNDRDCECLKYCTDLEALDLGHMAISDLSFVRYMPHLKYLVVVESNIVDLTPLKDCSELKYLEVFKCPIVDLSPLLEVKSLEDLNICYIWIPTQLAHDQLKQMTWLDRLWFCGTWFTEAQKQELQDAIPECEMDMRWGAESTGGTWRKHEHYYEMRDAFDMYYMPGGTNGLNEDGQWVVIPG